MSEPIIAHSLIAKESISRMQGELGMPANDELSIHDTVRVKMAGYRGKVGTIRSHIRHRSVFVYRVDLPGIGVLPFLRGDLERVEVER